MFLDSRLIVVFTVIFVVIGNGLHSGEGIDVELCAAIFREDEAKIEESLKKGADIDLPYDESGASILSALTYRASKDDIEKIKLLIKFGANVNNVDNEGHTPLHDAAISDAKNAVEIIKILIENGACVNNTDMKGRTPLHEAAMSDSKNAAEIINVLVGNGAKMNVRDFRGCTPLSCASTMLILDNISTLDRLGADFNVVDNDGLSPLHVMTVNITQENLDGVNTVLKGKNLDIKVEMLDDVPFQGCTPLHIAVLVQNAEAVLALLVNGADKNIRTNSGNSPLDLAERMLVDKEYEIIRSYRMEESTFNKLALITEKDHLIRIIALLQE